MLTKEKLYSNVSTIRKEISKLGTEGAKRAERLHLVACSALNHANETGDLSLVTHMLNAFGKAENPNEFRYWVSKVSTTGVTVEEVKSNTGEVTDYTLKTPEGAKSNIDFRTKDKVFIQREEDKENGIKYSVKGGINIDAAMKLSWFDEVRVREQREAIFNGAEFIQSAWNILERRIKQAKKVSQDEKQSAEVRAEALAALRILESMEQAAISGASVDKEKPDFGKVIEFRKREVTKPDNDGDNNQEEKLQLRKH